MIWKLSWSSKTYFCDLNRLCPVLTSMANLCTIGVNYAIFHAIVQTHNSKEMKMLMFSVIESTRLNWSGQL